MRGILLALLALAACGPAETLPPPPSGVTTLAVAPVENKTGSNLVIAGDSYIAQWLGREKRTVADVIGRELETTLRDRGFALGSGGGAPRMRIVLKRFEPDLPQLAYVSVALTATLADPDGTVRWSAERTRWLVSTANSPTLEAAYATAARTVARGLVDGWQPSR